MTNTLEKKVYTREEAVKNALEYFKGDQLAADVWANKYALKDSQARIYESNPNEMHVRLAKEIAKIETKYPSPNSLSEKQIYDLLKDFKYIIPGGSNMSGIGNDMQIVSLSNCFVIGYNENSSDSYGSILMVDQEQVQLMKRRGGVGHDLSYIRPEGLPVKNSALTSTGVIPFMMRYSNSTREVAQDGRRGALMLSLHIKHPEAEKFIDAKLEQGKITGANISVKIDDEFMYAVKNGTKYIQQFPINSENPIVKKEIDAKELWNKIIHNAWKSAEPGILFWDTIKRESIPDVYADEGFKTVSTNPCGEIPLCPYDSCRLTSLNLFSYIENPFTKEATFNYELFKDHAKKTMRIMDDIIDLELEKIDKILDKVGSDPEEEEVKRIEKNLWLKIKNKAIQGRRAGIGITAEGDMLAAMGLTYGTPEATKFSTEIHKMLALEIYRSSVDLAEERGAFPIYNAEKEKDNPFINRIKEADPELYKRMVEHGRRNISALTIAPNGSVSIVAQTTSGIEPAFLMGYQRKVKVEKNNKGFEIDFTDEQGDDWHVYGNVFHPKFKEWMKKNLSIEEIEKINNIKDENEFKDIIYELQKKSPYSHATSEDVDWVEKVNMQGTIQKWVDHSISATTNMPENVSENIVAQAYMKAWESGCKGHTIYREGSREGILSSKKDKNLEEKVTLVQKNVKPHPLLDIKPQSIKYKVKRQTDRLHMIPTSDLYVDDKNKLAYFLPDESFTNRLPPGTPTSASFTTEGILLSQAFRGADPDYVGLIEILQSISSDESEGIGPRKIKSIEHGMGIVLEHYLLTNGVIERDSLSNKLTQVVRKKDLRKVEPGTEEYSSILSQVRVGDNEQAVIVSGNNGKLDKKFICNLCGCEKPTFKDGCNSPVCSKCGNDNGVGCG
jgi:ribonucleoside-diphosphate reductase alpha chain